MLRDLAEVNVWSSAFNPGEWTLRTVLDHAERSDFGVFVMAPDDKVVIRKKSQMSVRDNVLFEAGIFMGVLGPERTFLLWPRNAAKPLHLPTDLLGLNTVPYDWRKRPRSSELAGIRKVIAEFGPALRSSYNEIASLSRRLDEQEQVFEGGFTESYKQIIAPVAGRKNRPWFQGTPVRLLMDGIAEGYDEDTVDDIFWWLIVYGVITFDNIHVWSSSDDEPDESDDEDDSEWYWEDSVDHAVFTNRGVVLLNQFRSEYLDIKPAKKRQ
jgi:hypothetical protein